MFNGNIFSKALMLDTQINVIVPDVPYDIVSPYEDVSVLYLLHGMTDNATAWARLTQAEYFAKIYNYIIIMPEVQRSFYTDMVYGPNYFTYVADELPEICAGIFKLPQGRKNTFIAGLSMGGYGAAKIGFSRPEKFAGIACFSAGIDLCSIIGGIKEGRKDLEKDVIAIFGADYEKKVENDAHALGVALAKDPSRPKLLQTCGQQDFLYEANLRFKKTMEDAGYGHTYLEWAGKHEWPFWNKSLELAMRFFRGEEVHA
jgi:S-formylglutathione hydrolase FrmB